MLLNWLVGYVYVLNQSISIQPHPFDVSNTIYKYVQVNKPERQEFLLLKTEEWTVPTGK